jgi:hypothetical protein
VTKVAIGDEFHPRYVPQSRYFQPQELEMSGVRLSAEEIDRLNREGSIVVRRFVDYHEGRRAEAERTEERP